MPRGKRKKGQFDFAIWLPTGGRLQIRTTADRSVDQWVVQAREGLSLMAKAVDAVEKTAHAERAKLEHRKT